MRFIIAPACTCQPMVHKKFWWGPPAILGSAMSAIFSKIIFSIIRRRVRDQKRLDLTHPVPKHEAIQKEVKHANPILIYRSGYTAPLTRTSMKTLVGNVVGNQMLVQLSGNNWNFSGLTANSDFNENFPWLTLTKSPCRSMLQQWSFLKRQSCTCSKKKASIETCHPFLLVGPGFLRAEIQSVSSAVKSASSDQCVFMCFCTVGT